MGIPSVKVILGLFILKENRINFEECVIKLIFWDLSALKCVWWDKLMPSRHGIMYLNQIFCPLEFEPHNAQSGFKFHL